MEIEGIKKIQTEGILGLENLDKLKGTTDTALPTECKRFGRENFRTGRHNKRNRYMDQRK